MNHTKAALALLCVALSASPALPQEGPVSSPGDTSSEQPSDERSKDRKRILHLANGSVMRSRARLADGHWEVYSAGAWRALPAQVVVRALDERALIAQARRMAKHVGKDATRRVALADWMAQQGLVTEAVGEINRVLAADPDHEPARELVGDLAPQLDVPALRDPALRDVDPTNDDAIAKLLGGVAMSSPAVQELAIGQLRELRPDAELKRALRESLTSHSDRVRCLSALALRRLFPTGELGVEELQPLIQHSVLDGSESVRAEACRALRDVENPALIVPAVRALASENAALRENSAQALGTMAYPAAVEPLIAHLAKLNAIARASSPSGNPRGSIFVGKQTAYIQDFDVEVAQFQAVADPQINVLIEGSVLDARVLSSSSMRVSTEARYVRRSLEQITGEDFGGSNRSWLDWWERNKQRWNSPPAGDGRTRAQ
jgi:hypothetical protein